MRRSDKWVYLNSKFPKYKAIRVKYSNSEVFWVQLFKQTKILISPSLIILSKLQFPAVLLSTNQGFLTSWGEIAGTWGRWAQAGRCSSCRWVAASIGGVRQCTGRACSWFASPAGSRSRRAVAAEPGRSAARPGWWEWAPAPTPAAAGSWRASQLPHVQSRSLSHCGLETDRREAQTFYSVLSYFQLAENFWILIFDLRICWMIPSCCMTITEITKKQRQLPQVTVFKCV